jgi:cysteinyl-tRNA synthetase
MDDDFNTAGAIAVVYELVSEINRLLAGDTLKAADLQALSAAITELLAVLGVELDPEDERTGLVSADVEGTLFALAKEQEGYAGSEIGEALSAILVARTEARQVKDWPRADAIRDGLAGLSLAIEDTPQGPRINKA